MQAFTEDLSCAQRIGKSVDTGSVAPPAGGEGKGTRQGCRRLHARLSDNLMPASYSLPR